MATYSLLLLCLVPGLMAEHWLLRRTDDDSDYFQCVQDGVVYKPGQKVPSDDVCEDCRCPLVGGDVECSPVECPVVDCVNPEVPSEECCGTCPWGSNCWLNERVIWADQWVLEPVTDTCSMTCRCPGFSAYIEDGILTQAECSNPCS